MSCMMINKKTTINTTRLIIDIDGEDVLFQSSRWLHVQSKALSQWTVRYAQNELQNIH